MKKITVTIIGTITQDTIRFPDGRKRRGYGGILYNILPLAKLAPESIKISPVCNLGSNIYNEITSCLEDFNNIDLKGITRVKGKNNHVFLDYDKRWDKEEVLKNLVPEIEFSQVLPFLECDLLLINFISGFDISLDSIKKIRKKSRSLIFMDVHSLLLGRREDGKRFFRVPPEWEEYLGIADILQISENTVNGTLWNVAQELEGDMDPLRPRDR